MNLLLVTQKLHGGIFEESRIRKSGRPSSKVSKEITMPRRNTLNQRSFETWTAITDTNYFSLTVSFAVSKVRDAFD